MRDRSGSVCASARFSRPRFADAAGSLLAQLPDYYYLELSLVPSSAPPPVAMMLPMSFPGFPGTFACE